MKETLKNWLGALLLVAVFFDCMAIAQLLEQVK